jgi:hypothetical protein
MRKNGRTTLQALIQERRKDAKGRKRAAKGRFKRCILIAMGVWPTSGRREILASSSNTSPGSAGTSARPAASNASRVISLSGARHLRCSLEGEQPWCKRLSGAARGSPEVPDTSRRENDPT